MKTLSIKDLDDIALGASVLGSGGGGNPAYDLLTAKALSETFGPPCLVELGDISSDDLVVPIEYMGAPLVGIEKIPSCRELDAIVHLIEDTYRRKVDYLLPVEIGGANALAPLMASSRLGIPVIDGDTLGRAFPELQISSCNVMGVSPSPAFIADAMGIAKIMEAPDALSMESVCRKTTVEMGSLAALALYLMDGAEAQRAVIPGTISQAMLIGSVLRSAREAGADPVAELLNHSDGRLIGSGVISDIDQSIQNGFLRGHFTIRSDEEIIKVEFQNEYLLAYKNGAPAACTPDILTLLDCESGTPILSESLLYGLRTALISLPAPAIWRTPAGASLTYPECFGYNVRAS